MVILTKTIKIHDENCNMINAAMPWSDTIEKVIYLDTLGRRKYKGKPRKWYLLPCSNIDCKGRMAISSKALLDAIKNKEDEL